MADFEKDKIRKKFNRKFEEAFSGKDFTELKEDIGYTLRDIYPAKLIKKLRIKEDHEYVPFFNFYLSKRYENDSHQPNLIPLIVGVELTLKSKDFYGTEFRYVLDDSKLQSKFYKPINIQSVEDFAFKVTDGEFYQRIKGEWKKVKLTAIKECIFKLHLSQYTKPVGLKARIKILSMRVAPVNALRALSWILGSLHWIINGIFFDHDPILVALTDDHKNQKHKPPENLTKDEIDFFGYNVKTWTLFSYSTFIILGYFLLRAHHSLSLVETIDELSLLSLAFAIVSIVIYDKLIPGFAKWAVKYMKTKALSLNVRGIKLDL